MHPTLLNTAMFLAGEAPPDGGPVREGEVPSFIDQAAPVGLLIFVATIIGLVILINSLWGARKSDKGMVTRSANSLLVILIVFTGMGLVIGGGLLLAGDSIVDFFTNLS